MNRHNLDRVRRRSSVDEHVAVREVRVAADPGQPQEHERAQHRADHCLHKRQSARIQDCGDSDSGGCGVELRGDGVLQGTRRGYIVAGGPREGEAALLTAGGRCGRLFTTAVPRRPSLPLRSSPDCCYETVDESPLRHACRGSADGAPPRERARGGRRWSGRIYSTNRGRPGSGRR